MSRGRFLRGSVLTLAVALAGCARACEAAGVEVIDGDDLEPLVLGAVGPRGLPPLEPLSPTKMRSFSKKTLLEPSTCEEVTTDRRERDRSAYRRELMNVGSMRRLRGRVAILDLRIASAQGTPWTRHALQVADDVALGAREFILAKASERQVSDLSIDVVPWFVTTTLPRVNVTTDALGRALDGDGTKATALSAVANATGVTVATVVSALKKRGYAEVAVMVTLPTKTISREWAGFPDADNLDVAFVQMREATEGQGTYAHELLHLGGADDLYRVDKVDPHDTLDLMASLPCTLGSLRIEDATAFAIGWLPKPPPRTYTFD